MKNCIGIITVNISYKVPPTVDHCKQMMWKKQILVKLALWFSGNLHFDVCIQNETLLLNQFSLRKMARSWSGT